jgi:rRNA biogenesis protein RRP5
LRNKIVKFGAKLGVKQGDLVTGYVTNISKAGVFVAMGHNLTARVALTELSDNPDFDFTKQMAIGMLVIGRITKVEAEGTRFSVSLRKSLVVHGVGQVDRKSMEPEQEHTCIILANAADSISFG